MYSDDESRHSLIWYARVGPRVRYQLVLSYLSGSEAELNPQPIPPGKLKQYEHLAEVLEAVAHYHVSIGDASSHTGATQRFAEALRSAADKIEPAEVRSKQAKG
jgi:hypothetical protein